MNDIDRRTVFVAGLAAASLISNATEAAAGSPEARLREFGIELPKVTASKRLGHRVGRRRPYVPSQTMCRRLGSET